MLFREEREEQNRFERGREEQIDLREGDKG